MPFVHEKCMKIDIKALDKPSSLIVSNKNLGYVEGK